MVTGALTMATAVKAKYATEGACQTEVDDDPPAFTSGPFLAAGTWPLLPTRGESPMYLDANYDVLWKFSDDFASCSGTCTHAAEYQAVGGSSWTSLDVTANAAKGYAYVTLPIESLQNATTYAFRYSVTDCASQTTQSADVLFPGSNNGCPAGNHDPARLWQRVRGRYCRPRRQKHLCLTRIITCCGSSAMIMPSAPVCARTVRGIAR